MNEVCPGQYCGRIGNISGVLSSCGPCPVGYRVNDHHECIRCVNDPTYYDFLYLGFMFMLPLIMHFYFINHYCESLKEQIANFSSAVLELVLSAVISVLLMDPVGSFHLYTCGVKQFSDWYTLFYNPSPNYNSKIHCTQEAVYPLQTLVIVFYLISLIQMIVFRFLLKTIFMVQKDKALYSAMYFFPILMFLHSVACGLIYYGFPYLSIFMSMITNAWHRSVNSEPSNKSIFKSTKTLIITGGHWFFLAYGIISLRHNFFLFLVPVPFLFYNFTFAYTDPNEFIENDE